MDSRPARVAAAYVVEHVRREAPGRWRQGPRRPALVVPEEASEELQVLATRDLYRLPRAVSEAVCAWARGERDADLVFALPSPRDVLALQARGRRCVSLLPDEAVPLGPIAGIPRRAGAYGSTGLAFAIHDLCHLEKLFDPATHHEQVGFFGALEDALSSDAWATMEEGLDAEWHGDKEHVLADMNGASAFLYVVLRNKLKLAVRRRVARARGGACREGSLDDREGRQYADAVELLVTALGLGGDARAAGLVLASRHEAEAFGEPLRRFFAARAATEVTGACSASPTACR